MTIRLYLDEDTMREAFVRALRARGVDVVTALEAGMIERPDREDLDYATAQGRSSASSTLAISTSCIRTICTGT